MSGLDRSSENLALATSSATSLPASRQRSVLLRLGWMFAGTLAMAITLMLIASQAPWTFGVRDLGLWAAVLATLTLRYWDIRHFNGETSSGEPATMAHFKRYAGTVAAVAAGGWLLAQAVHL